MAKKIRTTHTVLGKISSHGSGGRIDIIEGHPAIKTTEFVSPTLTTKLALDFTMRTVVVVRIVLSGKRRQIRNVRIDSDVTGKASFLRYYGSSLDSEKFDYERLHGGAFDGYTDPSPESSSIRITLPGTRLFCL